MPVVEPAAGNLYAAGRLLAGASALVEGSTEGIELATGAAAALHAIAALRERVTVPKEFGPMNDLVRMFEAYQDVEFTADWCVKCNICTAACPVAPVTELFPGPKTVGPQAQRFRRDEDRGPESPDHSVDYCSGCGICTMVCPHGVKIMEMNSRAREQLYDGQIPLRNRLLGRNGDDGQARPQVRAAGQFRGEFPARRGSPPKW